MGDAASWAGGKVNDAEKWLGKEAHDATDWVGDEWNAGKKWVGDEWNAGKKWAGENPSMPIEASAREIEAELQKATDWQVAAVTHEDKKDTPDAPYRTTLMNSITWPSGSRTHICPTSGEVSTTSRPALRSALRVAP